MRKIYLRIGFTVVHIVRLINPAWNLLFCKDEPLDWWYKILLQARCPSCCQATVSKHCGKLFHISQNSSKVYFDKLFMKASVYCT